jgi:hypothetical protein
MFASLAASLLSLSLLVARVSADVDPNEPSPTTPPFNEGTTCNVAWNGDTNVTSQAAWKSMSIQLMTGDNWNMKHISTIATNQDGSVSGSFKYPCPAVTLHAPVYFYQFSSAQTKVLRWTTRFTIATTTGETEPAPNKVQPSGDNVGWGIGALVDPSKAVPPPSYLADPSATGGSTVGNTSAASTIGNTAASTPSGTPSSSAPLSSKTPSASAPAASASASNSAGQTVATKGLSLMAAGLVAFALA